MLGSIGQQVAAMFVEPVQGTGTVVLTPPYIEHLLEARDEYGFLLVADEVATGFGRTGPLYASSEWPSAPDVLITSKGLTNGTCAASAVLVSERVASAFTDDEAMFVHAEVVAVSGVGCFRSAELSVPYEEVPGVVEAIRVAGAVVHPWPRGFSLIPPLIYTDDDLDLLFRAIRTALG